MRDRSIPSPLTPEAADALGRELDALRADVVADLGARDVEHIRAIVRLAYRSELIGRALLGLGLGPLSFAAGVGALALAKILENMEIGHNVMHGQYDWTGDPALRSSTYEWDMACAAGDWRRSHNHEHHTYTNVLGQDRDVGYVFLRIDEAQPWRPHHVVQPVIALGLALLFEWGIGMHDLRIAETLAGEQSPRELARRAPPFLRKAVRQLAKDALLYPALTPWNALRVLAGNAIANTTRNVWAFAVIFCGHFPEGVRVFRPEEVEGESRGQWYARQIEGSANLEGGRVMHILSGHLSHQIEHHLFPDIPASRYPEMAPRVRAVCARHGLAYRSGSLRGQLGSVARRMAALSLPPSWTRASAQV